MDFKSISGRFAGPLENVLYTTKKNAKNISIKRFETWTFWHFDHFDDTKTTELEEDFNIDSSRNLCIACLEGGLLFQSSILYLYIKDRANTCSGGGGGAILGFLVYALGDGGPYPLLTARRRPTATRRAPNSTRWRSSTTHYGSLLLDVCPPGAPERVWLNALAFFLVLWCSSNVISSYFIRCCFRRRRRSQWSKIVRSRNCRIVTAVTWPSPSEIRPSQVFSLGYFAPLNKHIILNIDK